jgi:hypothetical protein
MPRVNKKTAMPPSSKPSLGVNVMASPIALVSSNNEDGAIGDGRYVGELVNYMPHGKGRLSIGDIHYLGDWHEGNMHGNGMMKLANHHIMVEGVWDKGCCVHVEIVYFVNGTKWVATNEDGKGTMVLDDGSKHFGVGMWLDVIDWLLKGPVIANGITIDKPMENTSLLAKTNKKMLVVDNGIISSPLALKPLSAESVLADLNEMKARIMTFAEEDGVDSTTTAVLKVNEHQPATKTPTTVDVKVAENQVTVIMAIPPVRIVGNDTGSTATVVHEVKSMGRPTRCYVKRPASYREPSQKKKLRRGDDVHMALT